MIIIGIAGRKASGKDSIANALVKELGFERIGFADALKDFVARAFGFNRKGLDDGEFKERTIGQIGGLYTLGVDNFPVTPRELLKRIGTAMYEQFGEDFWINVVRDAIAKRMLARNAPPGFVIPDCRRFLEIKGVRSLYAHVATFLTPVGISPLDAGHRIAIIRTNRADRMFAHDFKDDGDGKTCGFTAPAFGVRVCGLLAGSHPSHFTMDTHKSETELPDDNDSLYHFVVNAHSAELAAVAGLEYVRALMTTPST